MRVGTGEDGEIGKQRFGFQNKAQTEQRTLVTVGVSASQRCSGLVLPPPLCFTL